MVGVLGMLGPFGRTHGQNARGDVEIRYLQDGAGRRGLVFDLSIKHARPLWLHLPRAAERFAIASPGVPGAATRSQCAWESG